VHVPTQDRIDYIKEGFRVCREDSVKLLDQRKQAKVQFLQLEAKLNGDNIKPGRYEIGRYFGMKDVGILKNLCS
jgi:hypothetical protein